MGHFGRGLAWAKEGFLPFKDEVLASYKGCEHAARAKVLQKACINDNFWIK